MPSKHLSLNFSCQLYDFDNKSLKSYTFDIAFFDIETNQWVNLAENLFADKGILKYIFTIPLRISGSDKITRAIRDVISSGCIPMFRLLKADTEKPFIISQSPMVRVSDKEMDIKIDFQKVWLLEKSFISEKEKEVVIATPILFFPIIQKVKDQNIKLNENLDKLTKNCKNEKEVLNKKIRELEKEVLTIYNENEKAKKTISRKEKDIVELTAKLSKCESSKKAEIQKFKNKIEVLNKEIVSLKQTIKNNNTACSAEKEALNKIINEEQENNNKLTSETNRLSDSISEKDKEIAALNKGTSDCESNKMELKNKITELETLLTNTIPKNDCEGKISSLNNEIQKLTDEYNSVNNQKEELSEKLNEANIQIQTLNDTNDFNLDKLTLCNELQTTKDNTLKAVNEENETLKSNIEELNDRIEELKNHQEKEHPNKLEAKQVYKSIVNDIALADKEMLDSNFRLANISLKLKATVEKGPEGTILGLIDFETAKHINGAAISDLNIDIIPNLKKTTKKGGVPNVLGLTETAVRKLLLSYGLTLETIYQPTKDEKLIKGQSFKQFPEPDSELTQGQQITVIFAKPINN